MKDSNRLIAEFMGHNLGLDDQGEPQSRIYETELGTIDLEDAYGTWNWVMPVVREILTRVELDGLNYDTEELSYNTLDCDIDGVIKEVVEFINHYNEAREPKIITYTDTREAATRCVNDLI